MNSISGDCRFSAMLAPAQLRLEKNHEPSNSLRARSTRFGSDRGNLRTEQGSLERGSALSSGGLRRRRRHGSVTPVLRGSI
jgi:hypothetical protein